MLRVTSASPWNRRFAPLCFYWIPTYCLLSVYRPVRAVDQLDRWLDSFRHHTIHTHYTLHIIPIHIPLQFCYSKMQVCSCLQMFTTKKKYDYVKRCIFFVLNSLLYGKEKTRLSGIGLIHGKISISIWCFPCLNYKNMVASSALLFLL